jgi:hypothetical protein
MTLHNELTQLSNLFGIPRCFFKYVKSADGNVIVFDEHCLMFNHRQFDISKMVMNMLESFKEKQILEF